MNAKLAKLALALPDIALVLEQALQEKHLPKGVSPMAIALPKNTQELSQLMAWCHRQKQTVVPFGGLSGLVDGTQSGATDLAVSLEKMNTVEHVDTQSRTMVVEAGVPLQTVQEAAAAQDMFFPLDLGARGSATIGGNAATNAGGNRVIRYGMMRDQVLGMEVVLADGTIVSNMSKVIKNNTGYDLKQLFIGSEGTLGIITKLILKLRPAPISQDMAFVALSSFSKVCQLLNFIDKQLGGSLSAFEVLWQNFYQLVTTPPALGRPPVPQDYPYYVLIEALGGNIEADRTRFIETLGLALEHGLIEDAAIANSQAECDAMWAIRDDVMQVGQIAPIYTFDVSVSLDQMESYITETSATLDRTWPDNHCLVFGHLGDSNLHLIISVGSASEQIKEQVVDTVYAGLRKRGGSISAEHGIGLQKRDHLNISRTEIEIQLMSTLKTALDPSGILNPGKVVAP